MVDASPSQLHAACVDNHVVWLRRLTQAAGGWVFATTQLVWAAAWRPTSEVTAAILDPSAPDLREQIDEIVAFFLRHQVERVSFWIADEARADLVAPWLEARGLRRGEQPRWMAADLHTLPAPPSAGALAAMMDVSTPMRFDQWSVPELTCYGPDTWRIRQAMVSALPQRVWHGVLWDDGAPAGQLSFNATEGELGVMGLHNFLILPQARMRGPGLDRFSWVTRFCLDLGCRYLVANALARAVPLYRLMNFRQVGTGATWWATRDGIGVPPSRRQVWLAEAIATGNLIDLADVGGRGIDLNQRLANGMTPLRFAGAYRRDEVARWLLAHGAEPDVLAAWDLGWRDEVARMLRRGPVDAIAQRSRSGKTLLHVAVERDDVELVRVLLAAGVDPAVRDSRFGSTALGWAVALRRRRIAAALRDHSSGVHDAGG